MLKGRRDAEQVFGRFERDDESHPWDKADHNLVDDWDADRILVEMLTLIILPTTIFVPKTLWLGVRF